jgi:sigma-B regulation protein RsbU (phosphoserine phosphatase)
MDSIFLLGAQDSSLTMFLRRLGYSVIESPESFQVSDIVSSAAMDLILIDGRVAGDALQLCSLFRAQQSTKSVPIVCITGSEQDQCPLTAASGGGGPVDIEIIPEPFTVGALASRIALTLRLRKLAGNDERKGSLAEINANLRDHNSRYKKELVEARAIQQSLLPRSLPRDGRFDLAVSYQPLDEVGGDWYFASTRPTGAISLHIADVSGHGLSAAFIGSMAKLAMTAADREQPHELLVEMNRLLAPQIPSGRFVTMGSCLYDPKTGDLRWARAGHPPALIFRRASGTVNSLRGEGFAVGFFEDSRYTVVEDRLEIGDALLLFTDGITEAQDRSGDAFGQQRLADALAAAGSHTPCADMLGSILDSFDNFRCERLIRDDVTLLLLKRSA